MRTSNSSLPVGRRTPAASHAMIVNKLLVRTIEAARAAPSQREPEAAVASAVGGTGSCVVGCLSGGGGGVGAIGCRRASASSLSREIFRTWTLQLLRSSFQLPQRPRFFFLYAAPPVVRRSTAPMLHTSGREPLKHTHSPHSSSLLLHTSTQHASTHSPHFHLLLLSSIPISALRRSQSPSAAGPSLPSSAS